MVTLHEVITFLVSMQISISILQTHNINRCHRSLHLERKLSIRRKRSSPNVFEMAVTETIKSIILIMFFFFSSRRRHTRFDCDWSSDVCSSDLGEKKLQGTIALEAWPDGTFRILTASTEIGQGTKTIFCQLAADALGVGLDQVVLAPQDTSLVPDSGPTVASRTAMIVGRLVQDAATALKERLKREAPPLRVEKSYIQPDSVHWDETTYRGDAYPVYAWACTIVDVDVDTTTGEVRVTDLVTAVDCGKALHPVMAEGQIEGGSLQAVGWATIEEIKVKDGGYQNDRLATYLIPTALDAPRIRTILVDNPYSRGPFGAKGVGELPMDGPAPAIIAAIHDATGVWLDEIPATPEKVLSALNGTRDTGHGTRS